MSEKKYGFGVDVGGTTVKIGWFEVSGKLLDKWEIKTNTSNHGEQILPDIAKAIDDKLTVEHVSKEEVLGIGIGVPGPVQKQRYVSRCVNLGWENKQVARELAELSGLPVLVGNDANVAALGEMWCGGARGNSYVIMVTLGTGVGGGIIADGKVLEGGTGAGGEIGHFVVNPEEYEVCNCGQYGCLEQYTSATGVVRLAKRKLAKSSKESRLRDLDHITAKDVFDFAKEQDAVAMEVVEDMAEILGRALANISVVVNPEIIVIGGGVSKAGEFLLSAVKQNYMENCMFACKGTNFALATLGNDAGMYGCMKLLLN